MHRSQMHFNDDVIIILEPFDSLAGRYVEGYTHQASAVLSAPSLSGSKP